MAFFVINEWLWADSSGENGIDAQRQAFQIIVRFSESDHQIIIIEGSRFDQKTWALCKSTSTIVKRLVTAFLANVRQNSDRCLLLKPESAAALPEELASSIKDDDRYLVRAQLSVSGAVLVTTDMPLREAVTRSGLPCLSREEFLSQYFGL